MTNFVPIAFLDTFELAASLRRRMGAFVLDPLDMLGPRCLKVRGPRTGADDPDDDLAFVAYKDAANWPELRATLGRISRIGEATIGGVEFGRVFLELLMPATRLPWDVLVEDRYSERFSRLHLPLRTNPAAIVYAGTEQMHLLPGQLTIVNQRAGVSAVNLGEWPRIHLVVDFKRKEHAAP